MIAGLLHNDTPPAWTTALTFASWSQAMGVLVLAVTFSEW
jgi:hypothetical protein